LWEDRRRNKRRGEKMREKLATIQKVLEVKPIEGADKIEAITILGWHLVAKKDEFNEGDLAVFIEVDSILPPDKEWSEFMRPRKFRVKTAKFMKMISQGLALPLNILPPKEF
jgi:RNA ligase (TIGR02306 family)